MNNQAAQTMPKARRFPDGTFRIAVNIGGVGFISDPFVSPKSHGDAMKAVAAALSQTAGVPEGIRGKVESVGICGMAHIAVDYTYYGPHILSKGDTFTLLNDKAAAPAQPKV